MPRAHLGATVRFLKHKVDQVSGFRNNVNNPHDLFMERLKEAYPDLAASLDNSSAKKRKWKEVVNRQDEAEESAQVFTFGFGDDIDEEKLI